MRISDWSSDVCSSDLAGAAHRLQVARELGVGLDLAAQARHLHVDGAGVAAGEAFLAQVVAGDRLAGTPRERLQQRGFGSGEAHAVAGARQFLAVEVRRAEHTSEIQSLMLNPYAVCGL